ncbi:hypothetical protein L218DRAFT_972195 [Marasmius fiardii PR-910]|nr:hypothetical protein L218DRAFT_972195 [Marasmius fiardii PR-910]
MVTTEQARHDEINLSRLIRRLEKSVAEDAWDEPLNDNEPRLKFAKKLLRNVEQSDGSSKYDYPSNKWKKTTPKPRRPEPILPLIPTPAVAISPGSPTNPSSPAEGANPGPPKSPAQDDLIPPLPSDPLLPIEQLTSEPAPNLASAIPTLLPSSAPSAVSKSTAVLMQNSNALQQELTDQLAQMSAQLRRNMLHFSDSLEKDAAVVEETKQKLESNFDTMSARKQQLSAHRGKSWSTTWLSLFVVIAVLVIFAIMVFLIRFT